MALQPFCELCLRAEGQRGWRFFEKAVVADHKTPATDERSFWGNELQSLCVRCHDDKRRGPDRDFHRRQRLFQPVEF